MPKTIHYYDPTILDIDNICGCVSSVKTYFNDWINGEIYIQNELIPIFNSYKNKDKIPKFDDLSECIQNIIINILCFLKIKYDNLNYNISVGQFIESYYNYNYDQSMIVLSFIENMKYINHGVSLRCCYIEDDGIKLIESYQHRVNDIKSFIDK
jgi:hypothetical protein